MRNGALVLLGLIVGAIVFGSSPQTSSAMITLEDLEDRLEELETLLATARIETGTINGISGPHFIFEGINFWVQDGSDTTDSVTTNGLGNIFIGYGESSPSASPTTVEANRGGSHNLVIGRAHQFTKWGGLIAGETNSVTGHAATVVGGTENVASYQLTAILGGGNNTASDLKACVVGGINNDADGIQAVVVGGNGNTCTASNTAVLGGSSNTASATLATVSGGSSNEASHTAASVSGGRLNEAAGKYSVVSGGYLNAADNQQSTVGGGRSRTASDDDDFVAGTIVEDN